MKHVRAVTRRRPVKLLALAATGLAVTATMAACGGGSSDKSTATSDCPNGKITLHEEDYYLPASATNFTGTNTQNFFDNYSKSNNCVKVTREAPVTSGGGANYLTHVLNQFSSHDQPDILMLDNPNLDQFAAQGLLAPLDSIGSIDTSPISPASIKETTFQGKLYGLGLQTNSIAIFYNKDLLDKAGISKLPTTWDEFAADAKKASQATGVAGFVFSGQTGPGQAAWQYYPWAWSNGAVTTKVDSDESVQALSFLAGMVKDGSVPKDVVNWSQDQPFQQFQAGKAVFLENGTWRIPTLQQENPNLHWGVMEFPTRVAGQTVIVPFGGEVWAIPQTTPEREKAALAVLQAMAKPDNIAPWAKGLGVVPTVPSLWDQAPWNTPEYQVFEQELKNGRARTEGLAKPENYPQIDTAIGNAEESALLGKQSAADALKQAQAQIDPLLK